MGLREIGGFWGLDKKKCEVGVGAVIRMQSVFSGSAMLHARSLAALESTRGLRDDAFCFLTVQQCSILIRTDQRPGLARAFRIDFESLVSSAV